MRTTSSIDRVIDRVLVAYQQAGDLSFCYGQGSVLLGFTAESDLDLVMIWRDEIPDPSQRPTETVADPRTEPVQHDGSYGGLDNVTVDGWPVDVAHYTRERFDDWVQQVRSGDGWQEHTWPLPLFAISGYAYGRLLTPEASRPTGLAGLLTFPPELVEKSRARLERDWANARSELAGCVRRSDGWLFHQLASPLVRNAYVAWFATHHRYCPFPKRLSDWVERFGLDPALAAAERRIWWSGSLAGRLEAIASFVDGVLKTSEPAGN